MPRYSGGAPTEWASDLLVDVHSKFPERIRLAVTVLILADEHQRSVSMREFRTLRIEPVPVMLVTLILAQK